MNILILSPATLNTFQQQVIKEVLNDSKMKLAAVLIDKRPRPSLKKRFMKNLKRGRGGYMLVMLLKSLRAKKTSGLAAADFFSANGIPCIETTQPYAQQTLKQLSPYSIDIAFLLGGFGIVKEPLLSFAPNGILSYHHGNMRHYRGQPPAFWELYNNEKEMGVTVQKMAAGLDKGTPIVEMTIPIEKHDTEDILRERALAKSTWMMHTALQRVQEPDFIPPVIDQFGRVYTLPNLRQYLTLKAKLILRKFK